MNFSVEQLGQIDAAVQLLLDGNVVGLPTETVYGLAADGTNADAVARIFEIKGRPTGHPLILHVGEVDWLRRFARDIPEEAQRLTERFWPGPLSLVLRRTPAVPDAVTGGRETVALRMPAHAVALEVIRRLGRPLAAPSANRFGRVSPTTRAHVMHDLGDRVPLVLEGGPTTQGVESTILDLSGDAPRLLRHGGISKAQIEEVLSRSISELTTVRAGDIQAPGMLVSHYAPDAPVIVQHPGTLVATLQKHLGERQLTRIGVIVQGVALSDLEALGPLQVCGSLPDLPDARRLSTSGSPGFDIVFLEGDAHVAARSLYAALRELDALGVELIIGALLDEAGIGRAVQDRLTRAAAPRDAR